MLNRFWSLLFHKWECSCRKCDCIVIKCDCIIVKSVCRYIFGLCIVIMSEYMFRKCDCTIIFSVCINVIGLCIIVFGDCIHIIGVCTSINRNIPDFGKRKLCISRGDQYFYAVLAGLGFREWLFLSPSSSRGIQQGSDLK